jgi:hypothetical protein
MTQPITETAREPASGNAEWHSLGSASRSRSPGVATAHLGLHRTALA